MCNVSLAGFFVKFFCSAPIFKRGFDDCGNTNSARKEWQVKQYTQQRLHRHRKSQEPMNKLKEAEFWYLLQGN